MEYKSKSWVSRNWKWFVPSGCLSLLIFVGLIMFTVLTYFASIMKENEVYESSLRLAINNPKVVEQLGNPIEDGWFPQGSYTTRNEGNKEIKKEVDLEIILNGSEGSGILKIKGVKEEDDWVFEILEVSIDNSDIIINLLEE